MNTGTTKTNFDFMSSTNTSNTSSSINTSTSINSFKNIGNSTNLSTTSTESMDLSFATEQVAAESKNIIESIGDFFSDLKTKVSSTGAVVTTSVLSGVTNIGEGIVDGLTWCGGKVVEGASWLVGKASGLFNDDTETSIMEWRDQAKTNVKEFIATDWVGEANDWFYQNTEIGQSINENSYLKYDSEVAQGITNATEFASKLAAATAATITTGGAAAPLALGLLFGSGEQAETLYQENLNTTGTQELGIFVSGLGEAANWYALGKLGQGGLTLANIIKENGLKQTGATIWNGLTSAISNIKTNGVVNTAKGILKNSNISTMLAADNLADSVGIIGDNVSDWLVGNEEFNLQNVASAGGELLAAWALNMFFDSAGDYLTGNQTTKITQGEITDVPNTISSNSSKQIKTMADEIAEFDLQLKNDLAALDPTSADYATKKALIEERAALKNQLLESIHAKGMTMQEYVKYCGTIAQVDPATQKLITEAAEEVHQKALTAEPTISSLMQSLETDGVYLSGFDHRFKSVDSIGRKVTNLLKGSTDPEDIVKYASKVNDNLRYTFILDETNYTDQMYTRLKTMLDEGYEVIGMNNSWGNAAYQGLNVSMLAPEGVRVEVQFHTEDSFYAKETLSHSFYEIKRSALADTADRDIAGKIQILDQSINVSTIQDLVGIPWKDIAETAKTYGT